MLLPQGAEVGLGAAAERKEPKPTLHRAFFVQTDQYAMLPQVGRLPIFLGGYYEELDRSIRPRVMMRAGEGAALCTSMRVTVRSPSTV